MEPSIWERIFTNPTSGLISNIYKELKKLDPREPNNPIEVPILINFVLKLRLATSKKEYEKE